ncbi:MAG TPA: bifunctional DNA-formamidopyrimidine glycosylase/DNA-(apurinic or apyrimidinic site) lyase [Anaerolineaceae bacterium]|nr:bifunctional DNA-formamidopyrimidine glycosylase/DNA-(apurinic or apyrimidinic site) lyase [Anaerolineaceae bacterium]
MWVNFSTNNAYASIAMPELPEVETIVRSLRNPISYSYAPNQTNYQRPGVVGRMISRAQVNWARSLAAPDLLTFTARIGGQSIRQVERRGKFLVFSLDRDAMLIHLRMSGMIRVEPQDAALDQLHDRVILNFLDDMRMVFNDTRKFGRLWLVENPAIILRDLGPEPLDADLDESLFYSMLQMHRTTIKSLLLNQRFIAGLGNIYTDEALHLAGIHPLQNANTLSAHKAGELLHAIRTVLEEGIRKNGTSIDWIYRGGDFQNHLRVYQRTGQPCYVCGTLIERITIGQRGSHFCPQCQPLHPSKL